MRSPDVWLRPDEAAARLTWVTGKPHTANAARILAHRLGWQRQGSGKSVRYRLADIDDEARRRVG